MSAAHPRSRGEHFLSVWVFCMASGSSPLARGTSHNRVLARFAARLIPARAGNIASSLSTLKALAAHPRSRGEHPLFLGCRISLIGSSPLARGTLLVSSAIRLTLRLIPARAGNMHVAPPCRSSPSAHPRSRGEHNHTPGRRHFGLGSSPLARGTLQLMLRHDLLERLIPARAGNISSTCPRRWATSAHPRSRGEHGLSALPKTSMTGSSPLARGTCQGLTERAGHHRLIPARAGNMQAVPP